MQIADHTVVSVRNRMKNSRGEVLENTLNSTPIHYLHGVGSLLPVLEADLAGLKAGDERTMVVSGEQGGGQLGDDFYLEVIIDGVRAATEEELRRGSPHQPDCGSDCECHR